ncbi:MAG: type III pantothenate kinase [Verrucomicrobiaceae bacterium]|nr:type III pantothenate kinase [Verrucomicrobiaceae bacterium]
MPPRPSPYLLIDIGNSRVKFALSTADRLSKRRECLTQGLTTTRIRQTLAGWKFGRVVLCSVVPRATAVCWQHFGDAVTELTHRSPLGFGFRYPKPATVGPDRLADVLAMSVLYAEQGEPGIVMDFGTAVTFNVLSSDRHYLGGVIAPGLQLMTEYLHERTALLPAVRLREPKEAIGRSTESAILSGAAHGYRGMVRGILESLTRELGRDAKPVVVATGGVAPWITAGMREVHVTDPDLTLHGLRLLGNLTA